MYLRPCALDESSLSIGRVKRYKCPFTQYKLMQKPGKWLKPWHTGNHLRVFNKSYPMNTNMTGFRWLSENRVLWTKVASALEGLRYLDLVYVEV